MTVFQLVECVVNRISGTLISSEAPRFRHMVEFSWRQGTVLIFPAWCKNFRQSYVWVVPQVTLEGKHLFICASNEADEGRSEEITRASRPGDAEYQAQVRWDCGSLCPSADRDGTDQTCDALARAKRTSATNLMWRLMLLWPIEATS